MGDQTNIVIWDAATHTEHFIRQAKFQADAADFGFIAPTPSKPELAEASAEAFDTLSGLKPKETHFACNKSDDSGVDIIQQVDIAGYRATTLLASDSKALAAWMGRNGYATTPAVEGWTRFYIAKGWYLTAFRVLNKEQVTSTGTVRMSFRTDQPFNPYFVPSDNIKGDRKGVLKLFFVSSGDYGATIGKSSPWQEALWTAPVPSDAASRLAEHLKLSPSAIPSDAQVAAYEDHDFPRVAADDLYFARIPTNPFRGLWGDAFVGFVLAAGIAAYVWRRRARSA